MKKVALVGHCGPDSSFLRITVRKAHPEAEVYMVDDDRELTRALGDGVELLLLNRELSYGFHDSMGVDLIKRLKSQNANIKLMLVSNYADAQAEAIAAGALPGFGKRELGSSRPLSLIHQALENEAPAPD
jgi:two-component system, chemotaxis family, chemotaxis protein CheY